VTMQSIIFYHVTSYSPPTFRINLWPPSSGSKGKKIKEPAESKQQSHCLLITSAGCVLFSRFDLPPKRSHISTGLHDVASQKVLFIIAAVRTINPVYLYLDLQTPASEQVVGSCTTRTSFWNKMSRVIVLSYNSRYLCWRGALNSSKY
jgi:hypothetical protein